jgi:hypothetical protein
MPLATASAPDAPARAPRPTRRPGTAMPAGDLIIRPDRPARPARPALPAAHVRRTAGRARMILAAAARRDWEDELLAPVPGMIMVPTGDPAGVGWAYAPADDLDGPVWDARTPRSAR